ncbi:hypothetical protein U1Q18_031809 [Sarracenia purpurea var. burkii]
MSVDTQSVDGRVRQRVDGTLKQFHEQLGAIPSLRSELEARLKILEERVEVLTFSMRDLWNRLRIFEVRLEERAGGIERRNGGLERMIQVHGHAHQNLQQQGKSASIYVEVWTLLVEGRAVRSYLLLPCPMHDHTFFSGVEVGFFFFFR